MPKPMSHHSLTCTNTWMSQSGYIFPGSLLLLCKTVVSVALGRHNSCSRDFHSSHPKMRCGEHCPAGTAMCRAWVHSLDRSFLSSMAISFTACSIPAVMTGPHCREDTMLVTLAALRVEFKVWSLLRTGNLSVWGWGHVPVWGLEPSQLLPPLLTASTWEAPCEALLAERHEQTCS